MAIEQPPRLTGNPEFDLPALGEYLFDLYNVLVVEGVLQGGTAEIIATDLPDPGSTTLAQAQETANQALTAAIAAQADADTANANALRVVEFGEVTISDTATTAVYTFDEAFEDTSYLVFAVPQTFSGAPNIDAFVKETETKAVGSVTIEVNTAPGAGTSVTFNILVLKDA